MRLFPFNHLPGRRPELLTSLLFILGLGGLIWLTRVDEMASGIALFTLELFLPLTFGIVAAGFLAGDHALELLLTMPQSASHTLGKRAAVLLGTGALLGTAILLMCTRLGVFLFKHGTDLVFIWLTPLTFSVGLSCAASTLRGRLVDGVIASLSWMGLALLSVPFIGRGCLAFAQAGACPLWLLNPLMTQFNPLDRSWPFNRLLWLSLGVGLLLLSLRLAQREEVLINGLLGE